MTDQTRESEPLIRARDIAERLAVSIDTVLRWSRDGRLPPPYRLSDGTVRWKKADFERWLEEHRDVA